MGDYVRQMPDGSADLARPPSAASRFHLDLPLLFLLMALTGYGLVVLYSASGQDMGAVVRQGRYFLVAYVVMIIAAQISLVRYMRWAPCSTYWELVCWWRLCLSGWAPRVRARKFP